MLPAVAHAIRVKKEIGSRTSSGGKFQGSDYTFSNSKSQESTTIINNVYTRFSTGLGRIGKKVTSSSNIVSSRRETK
jgi:hypothetical protein